VSACNANSGTAWVNSGEAGGRHGGGDSNGWRSDLKIILGKSPLQAIHHLEDFALPI